ncbi:MAG: RNAse ribonuclease [Candidatus Taylorbacteria bacterium]|nr:RNAse ribonuclease [Candidatus Taylorbacteria bacterium]
MGYSNPMKNLEETTMKSVAYTGTITTTRKGMGFIEDPRASDAARKSGESKDILIDSAYLNTALNGDTVEFIIHAKGAKPPNRNPSSRTLDNPTGEVVRIVTRARETFVGTVDIENDLHFVIPDDKRVYTDFVIPPSEAEKAKAAGMIMKKDDKIFVKFLKWEDPKKNPQVSVVRILGQKGINDVEMESIVLEKGFEVGFPPAVEAEAEHIEKFEKVLSPAELAKRRDFRQTHTFTIDPFDAKDFDDAISFKFLPPNTPENSTGKNLYEIGVHIADVSYYVREGSELDKEAVKRGCSIYLVDRTIPMLPEALSNDVCSLNPGADKATFSAVFTIDDQAQIHDRWFGRTIINSIFRFTYETAQTILDNKPAGGTKAEGANVDAETIAEHARVSDPVAGMRFRDELLTLNRLAKVLQKEKFAKGAIEFETEEIKFKLDAKGKPIGVYKKERMDTHKLVEEYMLLANREVARYIFDSIKSKGKRDTGAIYRIHDMPDKDRIANLATFAKALGYNLATTKDGDVTARGLNSLLEQIEGTPHESLLRTAAVRSMQKAVYSTKNIGHFGLAFEFYTHFTSPIRRYPDLLVHRILEKHLHNEPFGDREIVAFQHIAETSTDREIDAAEAERASKKLKQVEYMSERIGLVFEGTISGVTEWGMYVEEKETRSEGMINIRNLGEANRGDYFSFDKKTYSLLGEKTGKRYTLGDSVKFKVMTADLDKKTIDYALVA